MPRDAPLPSSVAGLRVYFSIDGRISSVGFWLFVPGAAGAGGAWAEQLLELAFTTVAGPLLGLMHGNCYLRAGQLLLDGIPYVTQYPGERGAHRDAEPSGITLTLHWQSTSARDSRRTITHLPGCPSVFVDDNGGVVGSAVPELVNNAEDLLLGLQTLPDPLAGHVVPIALRRRTKDGPLEHAVWSPIIAVTPGWQASTMRRRMPSGRRVPPPVTF
jgi:hypothetical protein